MKKIAILFTLLAGLVTSHSQEISAYISPTVAAANVGAVADLGSTSVVLNSSSAILITNSIFTQLSVMNAVASFSAITTVRDSNSAVVATVSMFNGIDSYNNNFPAGTSSGTLLTPILQAGTYSISYTVSCQTLTAGVGNWTAQISSTYVATTSISPAVQAALNAITAAQLAGDAALAAQITSLANQNIALQSAVDALTTRTTAIESSLTTQGQTLAELQDALAANTATLNSLTTDVQRLIANGTNGTSGSSGTDGTSTNWTEMLVPVGVSSAAGIGGAYLLNNSNRQGATATRGARPGYYD
jgi:uncharacterized coiled-coil protein SlyX